MKPLEKRSPTTEFLYWIEGFLKSRIRALNFEELWEKLEKKAEDAPPSYEEFIGRLDEINGYTAGI